jgi:uncharacterized metal-binding protein
MVAICVNCKTKACSSGDVEKIPKGDFCPMNAHPEVLEKIKNVYNENPTVHKLALAAARTEATGYGKWTRVEETIEFAHRIGAKKIGIAHCIGLFEEAKIFARIVEANGLEVSTCNYQCGLIPKDSVGIRDDEKVRPGTYENICNPVGQAEILAAEGTDLNVLMGLCVGHDSLFLMHSKAPVTVLVAKDRVTGHNPVAPLYASHSYYREKLYQHKKSDSSL